MPLRHKQHPPPFDLALRFRMRDTNASKVVPTDSLQAMAGIARHKPRRS